MPRIDTRPWTEHGTERAIAPSADNIISAEKLQGKIEIQDVKFAYPMRKDAEVFNDLSLSIEPGQTVALVGTSGSGQRPWLMRL